MKLNEKIKQMRPAYLSGLLTHQDYYSWLADEIGFTEKALFLFIKKDEIQKSTDRHVNDIPLKKWDAMHVLIFSMARCNWSLSDSVCVAKAVAESVRTR